MSKIQIGDRFFKRITEHSHLEFCSGCGRERIGDGWSGENNCSNCGKSYMIKKRITKPVWVLGIGTNYKGDVTLQISEKPINKLNDKEGYSYYNTTADKLGVEFFDTKKEASKDNILMLNTTEEG